MKKRFKLLYGLLLIGVVVPGFSLKAQNEQNIPRIKTTRTAVYKAVQKDTTWTTGAIVDHIYFVKYDKSGRKWIENSLNPDGSAKKKIIHMYGPDGNIKEEITASITKGGVTDIYRYSFDKWGKMDSLIRMDPERNITHITAVTRDEQGRIAKCVRVDNEESRIRNMEYVYEDEAWVLEPIDGKGRENPPFLAKRKLSEQDTILLRYSEKFTLEPKIPKKRKVDFEYDAFGNWVKYTEFYGVNPEFIVTRTIEYEGQENEWDNLALNGKVKSVYQTSYVAIPKGPGSIDKGAKKGVFFRYEFDKNGKKTLEEYFSETGVSSGTTGYTYNNKGFIEKETRKSATGKVEAVILWTYDENDRLKSKAWCDLQGTVQKKGVFRYDLESNCVSEMWFGSGSVKLGEFCYRYNPYGQQIEKQVMLCLPELASGHEPVRRLWNSRGRMTEEWIGQPENSRHFTYKYNSRGEVVGGTENSDDGTDMEFVYKFFNDERDNWKKKVKFVNDVPVVYEEREYTYYD